ncbi:flagellar basal-body MS-ring/collar protein FliF [Shewanella sp. GXUN23E]|uniref:flagellar basal-body MS-ring/collar protein FliF n=1 Tax=Shewanella sp. GXUN23E TaxID=3422498 RepID=UPI003D7DB149
MSTTLTPSSSGFVTDPGTGIKTVKQKLQRFTKGDQQVIALAILASVVACVIVLLLWTSSQGYRPLYGSQEKIDSASIIEVLDGEGLNYRLDANSGQILVREDQLGEIRMLLAARGVKAQVPSGMESLGDAALGTSQFMEQAKYRHSLEGELSRTIMALEQVRHARVHLAIPKRTLFIRAEPEKPTASVLLELYSGTKLQEAQIAAIANLVAGSVTGMTPDMVQIVDQAGNFLSADVTSNQDITQARDKQLNYTHELEQSLIKRAESMLDPILGAGNYQVQVAAMVNFNQVEETRESLDPQAIVTQENLKTDETNNSMGLGIPGALSNQPATAATEDSNNSRNLSQHQNRQYAVGRAVRHTRFQQMQLEKLSVSVLVNNAVAGDTGWQPQQLEQITTMVQDAIGFNSARGDTFSISNFAFLPAKEVVFEPLPWWQTKDYQAYLRYLIGGLLGLGLILFVLRPLVSHLVRTTSVPTSPQPQPALSQQAPSAEPQADDEYQGHSLPGAQPQLMQTALAQSLPPPGSPLTVKMQHLGLLANEEPARVAEVISHWIRDKDSE